MLMSKICCKYDVQYAKKKVWILPKLERNHTRWPLIIILNISMSRDYREAYEIKFSTQTVFTTFNSLAKLSGPVFRSKIQKDFFNTILKTVFNGMIMSTLNSIKPLEQYRNISPGASVQRKVLSAGARR